MKCIESSGRGIGLAALIAAAAPSGASAQDLHVAVWGLDGALLTDAAVGFETAAGTHKGGPMPDGCFHVDNELAKGTILVEHPALGRVGFEVSLPNEPLVDVDVIFLAQDQADLVIAGPAKISQGRERLLLGAPANDLCANATGIMLPAPGNTTSVMGTTLGATFDGYPFCGTSITTGGVWYRVAGNGHPITATTCNELGTYDSKITVYCGSCEIPICVAGNDDDCTGGSNALLSTVTWCSQAGAEYLVLVHGFGSSTGDFVLELTVVDGICEPTVGCTSATGACCLPSGECEDGLTEAQCLAANGYYQGDDVACEGQFLEYVLLDVGDTFTDISGTGTDVLLGDDDSVIVPIGFDFPFFGEVVTHAEISSNGYITFGGVGDDFSNDPCLSNSEPNAAVFGLWDDLNPLLGGSIQHETVGPPGSRVFFVQWTQVAEFGVPTDTATFQVALAEFDGFVFISFHELNGIPSTPGDATSGIEDETGLTAVCLGDAAIGEGRSFGFLPTYQEPVTCPCRLVDFSLEDDFATRLVNGQDLTSPPEFGVLFELAGAGAGVVDAAIFDSDPAGPNVGGPDPDLLVDLGNILILQSVAHPEQTVPGIFDVPDDNSTGGYLTLDFLGLVEPRRVDLVDLCLGDYPTQIFLWDADGDVRSFLVPGGWTTDLADEGPPGFGTLRLDTLAPQPGANGTQATASDFGRYEPWRVQRMEVFLGNSGGLDNLEFCYPGVFH